MTRAAGMSMLPSTCIGVTIATATDPNVRGGTLRLFSAMGERYRAGVHQAGPTRRAVSADTAAHVMGRRTSPTSYPVRSMLVTRSRETLRGCSQFRTVGWLG